MKRLANIFEIVLLVIMLCMCGMILMAGQGNVPYIFGYRVMQVISDSMRPTIAAETCIVIEKVEEFEDIRVGDVITFVSEDPRIEGYHNTHRVNDIITDAETGEVLLQTKGDAYETPDAHLVSFDQVTGRYVGELPFGKYLYKGIQILADRVNYFIIVIAPLFLCFLSYFKQLLVALFKPASEYGDESDDDEDEEWDKPDEDVKNPPICESEGTSKETEDSKPDREVREASEETADGSAETLSKCKPDENAVFGLKMELEIELDEELKAQLEEKVRRELTEAMEMAVQKRK